MPISSRIDDCAMISRWAREAAGSARPELSDLAIRPMLSVVSPSEQSLRSKFRPGVCGHERVPTGGQVEVPTGGLIKVPNVRRVDQELRAPVVTVKVPTTRRHHRGVPLESAREYPTSIPAPRPSRALHGDFAAGPRAPGSTRQAREWGLLRGHQWRHPSGHQWGPTAGHQWGLSMATDSAEQKHSATV
jgi:hypothetical protein